MSENSHKHLDLFPYPIDEDMLIEQLAEYSHKCWSETMRYLFNECVFNNDGTATLPIWIVEDWEAESISKYSNLSDATKEKNREEARKMLDIISKHIFG